MGILTRFADIMKANINALLENVESKNADKILEQYLREAREDLEEVKSETAAVIADEMAAARKVADYEAEIVKLTRYAEQAVMAGNDGDAVKFLEGKNKAASAKADAEKNYEQAKINSDRMRQLTKKLVGDINEANTKLEELKTKLAVAEQAEKMNDLQYKFSNAGASLSDYSRLSEAVQKRIDAVDAKANLDIELNENHSIDELKKKYDVPAAAATTVSVNDELAALKAKLKK